MPPSDIDHSQEEQAAAAIVGGGAAKAAKPKGFIGNLAGIPEEESDEEEIIPNQSMADDEDEKDRVEQKKDDAKKVSADEKEDDASDLDDDGELEKQNGDVFGFMESGGNNMQLPARTQPWGATQANPDMSFGNNFDFGNTQGGGPVKFDQFATQIDGGANGMGFGMAGGDVEMADADADGA